MSDDKKKISAHELRKLEFTGTTGQSWEPDRVVEAIVKVGVDDYVPEAVDLRTRVDSRIFTATFKYGALAELEDDPEVASVAVSRPLFLPHEQESSSASEFSAQLHQSHDLSELAPEASHSETPEAAAESDSNAEDPPDPPLEFGGG